MHLFYILLIGCVVGLMYQSRGNPAATKINVMHIYLTSKLQDGGARRAEGCMMLRMTEAWSSEEEDGAVAEASNRIGGVPVHAATWKFWFVCAHYALS